MTNIDQSEVEKFNEIASRWWDANGECKPLHEINPIRLQFITAHAELAGKQVADIGCGGGILTESLARLGGNATGIDMAEEALKVAKLHQHESKLSIDYQLSTAEDYAQQHPAKFDVLTCMELLEHVPEPASLIKACSHMLKPGGKIFFSTLNRNPKAYAFAIVGAEYLLKMLPKGTHDYKKFIKPSELEQWMADAGLKLKTMGGMSYNPFTKIYRLSDDVSVNYLMYGEKDGE